MKPRAAVSESHLDVESALLRSAYERNALDAAMTGAAVAVGAFLLWPYLPHDSRLVWLIVMLAVPISAGLNCWAYFRAKPGPEHILRWRVIFAIQITLAGAGWSVGPVLMMWPIVAAQAVMFVGILFCVSAVAVASLSDQRGAMQGFVLATMLPTGLTALFRSGGGGIDQILGLVLLAGAAALIAVGRASHATARKFMESEQRLKAIVATAPDAVIGMNESGHITDWNQRAQEMFGWTYSEAKGRLVADLIALPAYREAHRNSLARFLETHNAEPLKERFELLALRASGEKFPVEVAVTPIKLDGTYTFTAFVTDISVRKASQERLDLFRRVFDASEQCIGISDGSGINLYQNRAQSEALGYPGQEFNGKPFETVLPPENTEVATRRVREAAAQGRGWFGQLELQRKDGSRFMSLSNIGFIKGSDGRVQYAFNIFSDFTEELARRRELAQAKEDAERANQAKSDFLSSMSHELRTPMNAILGFAQMLEYDTDLNADQQDNVQEILKAGKHLLELINEVLDLARIESGKMDMSLEGVSLSVLLDDCRDLVQSLADSRGITIALRVSRQLAVRADRTKLKQALLNLLSNAVKYNREGGTVTVTAKAQDSTHLRIAVVDTGTGIAPERVKELFQPFNRLGVQDGPVEGTGIGLTITRRLVEMMGGEVGVTSTPGVGTTFWIVLPIDELTQPLEIDVEDAYNTVPAALEQRYKVLYVDDNHINLKLVELMLARRPNIEVATALTPELGIELALTLQPDVILLDINMPGMDGYQVLDILMADPKFHRVPVIAVTANAMPRDIERGREAGFTHYLTKPINVREFMKTLDECLLRNPDTAQ